MLAVGVLYMLFTDLRKFPSVLVCLGCHNRLPWARELKQQIYFLTVLQAISPRLRCQQGWCLVRAFSLACRYHLLIVSSYRLSSGHVPNREGEQRERGRGRKRERKKEREEKRREEKRRDLVSLFL